MLPKVLQALFELLCSLEGQILQPWCQLGRITQIGMWVLEFSQDFPWYRHAVVDHGEVFGEYWDWFCVVRALHPSFQYPLSSVACEY